MTRIIAILSFVALTASRAGDHPMSDPVTHVYDKSMITTVLVEKLGSSFELLSWTPVKPMKVDGQYWYGSVVTFRAKTGSTRNALVLWDDEDNSRIKEKK